MKLDEELRKIREKLDNIPLKKRVALGGKGVELLRKEHLLLCQKEREEDHE